MKHIKKYLVLESEENIGTKESLSNEVKAQIVITNNLIKKRLKMVLGISGMDCIHAPEQVIQLFNQMDKEHGEISDKIDDFYKRLEDFLDDSEIYDDVEIEILELTQKNDDFNSVKGILEEIKDVYISRHYMSISSKISNILKNYGNEISKNV
jgi:hypothetical protein